MRRSDPYKNRSKLNAAMVLIRAKADRIDTVADALMTESTNDATLNALTQIKVKANEIVDIVEAEA